MAGAIHPIHDTDNHFIVDPITRAVKNETVKKLSLVIDDHNSEIFTFELPRYVEGHDMAKCNKVEVHYVNTHSTTKEKSAERYKVTDFAVDPADDQKVTFSWTISEKATKYAGALAFALHFACMDEITEEVHYWWSTATNNTITVLDCINLTPEDPEEKTDLQEKTATPTKATQVVRPDGDFRGLSRVLVEPIPEEFIIPTGTLFVDANGNYEVREFDTILVSVPDIPAVLQEKEITANGTHTPDTGFEGFSAVHVNVADVPAVLQEKTVYPSTSEQTVEPDRDFDGLSKVTVGPMKLQNKTAQQNGDVIADDGYHGLQKVTVRVEPKLQNKTAEQNGEVIADSGYDGLQKVTVRVEPKLQDKIITTNGEVIADSGFDGLSKVTVNVSNMLLEKTITENGTYTPPVGFDGFSAVHVNVAGGLAINGIVEQYKVNAGATVNAGDFVAFVNKFKTGMFASGVLYSFSACKLDNSRVLIAYCNNDDRYGTAVVLSFGTEDVAVGEAVVFERAKTDEITAVALTDSKVLVAYRDNDNSSYGTAIVLTVNGTTITAGTPMVFESKLIYVTTAVALTDSKVLVAYQNRKNSDYGTAIVLTVNGTTITAGTAKVFASGATYAISAVALTDSKVLVAYRDEGDYKGDYYGTAIVLTVNGTTITAGTAKVFKSGTPSYITAVALADSKVLVAYRDNDNSSYGTAIVLTVNGTTITAGTAMVFASVFTYNISAVALTDSKVLVAYRDNDNSDYGTAIVLTVNGTTITVGTAIVFASGATYSISAVALTDSSALVAYRDNATCAFTNLYINGTSITTGGTETGTFVQPATSRLHNVGVAATSGAEGETVGVYCVG